VWPTLEEAFGDYAARMNTIPTTYDGIDTTDFDLVDAKQLDNGILGLTYGRTTRKTLLRNRSGKREKGTHHGI
jgi:hypothetical protein